MARNQTIARFHVIETDHGYRVVPPERELFWGLSGPPTLAVKNNLDGVSIELEVETGIPVSDDSGKHATTGKEAVIVFGTPKPAATFEFYVWVDPGNYKVPAASDPRVKPK